MGSVALGEPLRDGGREPLAAFRVTLLVLGRASPARAPVADHLAAVRTDPPEHAGLPAEVGRPLRRVLPRRLAQAADPRARASPATPRASPTSCQDMPASRARAMNTRTPARAARSSARAIRMPAPGSGCSSVNDAPGHGGAWTICAPVMYARRSAAALTAVPASCARVGRAAGAGAGVAAAGHAPDGMPRAARQPWT